MTIKNAQITNQNNPQRQPVNTEMLWEAHHQKFLAGSRKLSMDDYNILRECLTGIENEDSYAVSPAYYLMTCRKSLWLYQQDDQFILFGWHPNVKGQILVFNPLQNKTQPLLETFTQKLPSPPAGTIIARVQKNAPAQGHFIQEDILDWIYPVQTLSTENVTLHKGTCFRDLRKNLYRADKESLTLKALTEQAHFIDALRLINGWSGTRASDDYRMDDLSDPQVYILKLLKKYPHAFEGFTLYSRDMIAGLCIWEKSDRETINSFVSVSRPDMRGLSDYVILQMCQQLYAQGHNRVCIGGSESAGLDAFKRKFNPVHSLPLYSMEPAETGILAVRAA